MPRCVVGLRRLILTAVLICAGHPRAINAQENADEVKNRLEVGPISGAWCVHFLIEPSEAQSDLTRGYQTSAARQVSGLPTQLRRILADEPQYADWIPAQLCVVFPDVVTVDKRQHNRGDRGRPLAIVWWGVAAVGEGMEPGTGGFSLRLLATTSSGLNRQMELSRIPIDRVTIERGPIQDTEDERIRMRLDKVEIVFDGRSSEDSTSIVQPFHQMAVLTGNLRHIWVVETSLQASSIASLTGALRIQGKGDLAKALNRSPIRLLGTSFSGSGGEVTFREAR